MREMRTSNQHGMPLAMARGVVPLQSLGANLEVPLQPSEHLPQPTNGLGAKANSYQMSFMSVRASAATHRPIITIHQEMFS